MKEPKSSNDHDFLALNFWSLLSMDCWVSCCDALWLRVRSGRSPTSSPSPEPGVGLLKLTPLLLRRKPLTAKKSDLAKFAREFIILARASGERSPSPELSE